MQYNQFHTNDINDDFENFGPLPFLSSLDALYRHNKNMCYFLPVMRKGFYILKFILFENFPI